ncbi:MAG: MarR family transcriptional regulator [Alphaproteobacteria bacterium]|nr:MarR family transcriptional regulator [Alphaproteobacteria bacterium]
MTNQMPPTNPVLSGPPPADFFELQSEVGWLIYDVSRMLFRAVENKVKEAGITSQQWRVLIQLAREDGHTQSQLSEESEIAPAPLGRLLDRLEEQNIIERRPDPSDRRVKRICLAGGEQGPFFERLKQLGMQQFETVYKSVNKADIQELYRLLQKLKSNMLEGAAGNPPVND